MGEAPGRGPALAARPCVRRRPDRRRAYEAETRYLKERLSSLVVPEVNVAVEAGILLERIQDLWQEATLEERHALLSGMIEAVYIDLPSRVVVGITPKGPFRQAFSTLEGETLVPPEEARTCTLWWRRRGLHLYSSIHLAAQYGAFLVKPPGSSAFSRAARLFQVSSRN
jgi:hypothetical protein